MKKSLLKSAVAALAACLTVLSARAQELNCKVSVQHAKIQNVDPQVFRTLERTVTEFMNNRKWTTEEFAATERIDVNILLNLTERTEEDVYRATITISATRPVFNSSYTSPLINYMDRDLIFKYSQFTPFQFDDNRVSGADAMASNLTAVLAYYAYLVIGLDYDSFSPEGGTNYFKKAQNVVANAPEQGKLITGWKAFDDRRNRYWIMDQLLNSRFAALRTFWYNMHRQGLDVMYNKPAEGRNKIMQGLAALGQLQRDNPGATLLQFFFNAKSDELMRIVSQVPREERAAYLTVLAQIDVPNAAKYNALK